MLHKVITSSANDVVKKIRKLNNKKYRDESGLFFVEGLRHVIEGLQENAPIEILIICPTLLNSVTSNNILQNASDKGIEIIEVKEAIFKSLANKEGPQGIAGVFHQNLSSFSDVSKDIWVGLNEVQDPGNLGSILRTLDAVGGKGVVLIGNSTDPFHPTSVRASMGAIFTQKIVKSTLREFIKWVNGIDLEIIGTSCQDGIDYQAHTYRNSTVLLMGSEQKGLHEDLKKACNKLINIPMVGKVDSLNLANAASIILYEIYNQQRK